MRQNPSSGSRDLPPYDQIQYIIQARACQNVPNKEEGILVWATLAGLLVDWDEGSWQGRNLGWMRYNAHKAAKRRLMRFRVFVQHRHCFPKELFLLSVALAALQGLGSNPLYYFRFWIRSMICKATTPIPVTPPATTHSIHSGNGSSISIVTSFHQMKPTWYRLLTIWAVKVGLKLTH